MAIITLIEGNIQSKLAYSLRGSVHYGRKHGSMQADKVLHLDLQAAEEIVPLGVA